MNFFLRRTPAKVESNLKYLKYYELLPSALFFKIYKIWHDFATK